MKKSISPLNLFRFSAALTLSIVGLTSVTMAEAAQRKILLTNSEKHMADIALDNQDHDYIIVDKVKGKLIIFEMGRAIFIARALTGMSTDDVIPASTFHLNLQQHQQMDKVTPAGRFTLSKADNAVFGKTLVFNEVYGDTWVEAIHPCTKSCWKLHLPEEDRHQTLGCVEVAPKTMAFLSEWAEDKTNIPIYVMPEKPSDISRFFPTPPALAQ